MIGVAIGEAEEERSVRRQAGADDGESGLDDRVEKGHGDGGRDVGEGEQRDGADTAGGGGEDAVLCVSATRRWWVIAVLGDY